MLNRGAYFWGGILIVVGVVLFLANVGILTVDVWKVLIPLVVILVGALTLWTATRPRPVMEAQALRLPLENAARASVKVRFGAGRLQVRGGADPSTIIDGTFRGGVESDVRRSGSEASAELRVPSDFFLHVFSPWMWWGGPRLEWDFGLTETVPVALDVETGASEARLDLTRVLVDRLRLSCGASSVQIQMPAGAAMTTARIESGAASVVIDIPQGVAARIEAESGLANVRVNTSRFPRIDKVYRSADYDTAPHRLDLHIEAGVASVDVN